MKIGLYGYGRMGQAVERLALAEGDTVAWKVGSADSKDLSPDRIREADVVVEFSSPEAALENVTRCLRAGVRVVSGTTGWNRDIPRAEELARDLNLAFLQASNFSVGVNLFFAVNAYLASLMAGVPGYSPSILETHHVRKKDAPSGTAITLAERVIRATGSRWTGWTGEGQDKAHQDLIPIRSLREDDVPGIHELTWSGPVDRIMLCHEAVNRDGFAHGAWLAARWILGKTGIYTMADVLGLPQTT